MANQEFSIQCINERCNTNNSNQENVCTKCRLPLVRRYLRVMGDFFLEYQTGDLIDERFYYYGENILIDTKPNLVPPLPNYIPEEIISYLKLFKYRIYTPQIYGLIKSSNPLWLLEYDSVPLDKKGDLLYPQLFPLLDTELATACPLRQLNWFYQIVKLWQPLSKQEVLASLFQPDNLRVDVNVIKIMELHHDYQNPPNLVDLGNLWSNWLEKINELIRPIIHKIVASLQQNLINNINDLISIFDQIIYLVATNYYDININS